MGIKIWRHERPVTGPVRATEQDIDELNRVFSDSFTDRYRRDGMIGVRVPQLNPDIWNYAIRDAGDGAMIWRDEDDRLLAFNMSHYSGAEGWMGPLAVRSDRQGEGFGKLIVGAAIEWLKDHNATTIGLETMPRTMENIGFYGALGFLPRYLTVTMSSPSVRRSISPRYFLLGTADASQQPELLERCRRSLQACAPGYDFTREHRLTEELGIGDTLLLEDEARIRGFALWHSASLADDKRGDELRVLKLFADSTETFERLLSALEKCASRRGIPRVTIRCQTFFSQAFRSLTRRGYKVTWTDLRMTLDQFDEKLAVAGAILLSNWEI